MVHLTIQESNELSQDNGFQAMRRRVEKLESELATCQSRLQTLRENESRYRTLVELCPSAIVVHGEEKTVYANAAAATLAAADSPDRLIGRSILDFVAKDGRAHVRDKFENFDHDNPRADFAVKNLTRLDGETIHAEVLAIPITIDGQPAVLATIKDTTARIRKEEEDRWQQSTIAHTLRLATIGETCAELVLRFASRYR